MTWYNEFVAWAKGFFSVETEAEISQATQKFTSLKQMTEDLKMEALAAVQQEMDGIKSTVADLTDQVKTLTDAVAAKDAEITALTEKVTGLTTALAAKDDEIAALVLTHTKERNTLSAEVARLTAGKKSEQDEGSEGLTGEAGNGQKQRTALVQAKQVSAFINGSKN